MKEKIIQIMEAPTDLYIEYKNEEEPDKPFRNRVICLALTENSEVYVMDIDDTGFIDKAEAMSNYYGVIWKEDIDE